MRTELNSVENALITEAAAADYLGISIRTIQAWRWAKFREAGKIGKVSTF
ncbi:hypothetical protein SAMN04488518_110200 [Pseudovibrio ascidiaceicola]|uniref:Helix-turn-helix domain-containing protein n=1 Tax=Pseudovibrio ascidiaceicola TaxID=285279 RepID=A0A1I4D218_9HYPH|nr:hypothetical protein SAMN04488518_110200 [Pseudovibrio ascidiaceicola]